VTDDPHVGGLAAGLGAIVLPDAPAAGLNEALTYGAAYADEHWPERGRAGLAGDLPAIRPGELAAALATAARLGSAFVPDADGTGTTLYAAAPGTPFRPRFGLGSRDAHLAGGAAEVRDGITGLRRDVDTAGDLRLARHIGLGPHTAALLAADGE
jgi:2-phospho-L-lactate guanylyltransferase